MITSEQFVKVLDAGGALVFNLARNAHEGQVDKLRQDYFEFHILPIAESLIPFGPHAVQLGLLHDIVEDTDIILENLHNAGVASAVVRGVDSVTRREGEEYEKMIKRACEDPLGRLGKLADNWQNLSNLHKLPRETQKRLRPRYVKARQELLAAIEQHGA